MMQSFTDTFQLLISVNEPFTVIVGNYISKKLNLVFSPEDPGVSVC